MTFLIQLGLKVNKAVLIISVLKMNDFISDEELVSQIASSSDSQSFAILYDRYSNTVYNKCLSFVKSKEEAQDITHDIFIKLYFKLSSFKGNAKFSTWLYSFTYNFCVNHVQRVVTKKVKQYIL